MLQAYHILKWVQTQAEAKQFEEMLERFSFTPQCPKTIIHISRIAEISAHFQSCICDRLQIRVPAMYTQTDDFIVSSRSALVLKGI